MSCLLFSLSGCGENTNTGGDPAGTPGQSGTADSSVITGDADTDDRDAGKRAWDPSLGTATVTGVVRFEGDPPRRRAVDLAGRAECADLHTKPILDQTVIVGPEGALKNVIVWVKSGLAQWRFPKPDQPVILDQKGCVFHPHVVAIQVGQDLLIHNSDPFAHNVHAIPTRNPSFNFTQGQAGAEDIRTFSRPELMAYLKCDMHGWMSAYVNVMPHPYFDVTQDDGTFELPKLPPGTYTLEAQHESLGKQATDIIVSDGEVRSDVEFRFREK
jgi:plastocyanin